MNDRASTPDSQRRCRWHILDVGPKEKIILRYYYPEHLEGYARLKAEGKIAWNELHGEDGFDNFSSRSFLESVLPRLNFSINFPDVLEYGCGTGPGACFLAERGYKVDGIDIVPLAIEMARKIASQRGLNINFKVADVCELPTDEKKYDLIVDSYCLQCIVFDDERKALFSSVQSRLKPGGYYLVSTAFLDREHEMLIGTDTIKDHRTGVVYTQYGSGFIDIDSGIALYPTEEGGDKYPDAIRIEDRWYLPGRRHLRASALEAELIAAGFEIVFRHDHHDGSLACKLKK